MSTTKLPGRSDARQWGLWNEDSIEQGDVRRGLLDTNEHLSHDVRSAPGFATRGADPEGPVDRPQTSPECVDSNAVELGEDKSTNKRMHSRLLLQSAMDTSGCLPLSCSEETAEELNYVGTLRPKRCGFVSSKTAPCDSGVDRSRLTTSPCTGASFNHNGGGIFPVTESTGHDSLQNSSASWNYSGQPQSESSRPQRSILEDGGREMKPLDGSRQYRSGLSDRIGLTVDVPKPRVWGKKQMMAAVAAATGRIPPAATVGPGYKTGPKQGTPVISKGVVRVDNRLSKARDILRRDAFDAAERAGLPLLQ